MKKHLILYTLFLAVAIAAVNLLSYYLNNLHPGPTGFFYHDVGDTPVSFRKADNFTDDTAAIYLPEGRNLKILILADPQIDVTEKYSFVGASNEKTFDFISALVDTLDPDLTVIAGDLTMMGRNNQWPYLQRYAEIFEEADSLWAFTFGNHDSENGYVDDEAITVTKGAQMNKTKVLTALSAYPHCLSYVSTKENVGDYVINVLDEQNNLVRTLFFMDCEYRLGDYSRVATAEQKAFYRTKIDYFADMQYGEDRDKNEVVPSVVFTHVPLAEYAVAVKAIGNGDDAIYHYGDAPDGSSYTKFAEEDDLFNAMLDEGSTDSVFFGHFHDNDLSVTYKGIRMTSVQHSGFAHNYRTDHPDGAYGSTVDFRRILTLGDDRGGVLLGVEEDGDLTHDRILAKEVVPDYSTRFAIDYAAIIEKLSTDPAYTVIA